MSHSLRYLSSTTLSVCSHAPSKETERAYKTIHSHIFALHGMEVQYQAPFAFKLDNYLIDSSVGSTIGYRLPTPQVAVQFIATHIYNIGINYILGFQRHNDVQLRFVVWQPHVSTNSVQTVSRGILLFLESLGGVTQAQYPYHKIYKYIFYNFNWIFRRVFMQEAREKNRCK
jgi:hypothetical protein